MHQIHVYRARAYCQCGWASSAAGDVNADPSELFAHLGRELTLAEARQPVLAQPTLF